MIVLKKDEIVEFDRKKQFKFIRPLGSGGTGDAYLFEDETTELFFAFKKYFPKDLDYIDEYYERFVDEIKILFNIYHPNIVRVYNYYLYSEFKTGYLQMEFVEGIPINEYVYNGLDKNWEEIFIELVHAFQYLEGNKILHRDIRPANILIDNRGNIKIIDFGFGKRLQKNERDGKSVLLNWPVTNLPKETLKDSTYNHQTEVYFVGKLFKNLLTSSDNNFKFMSILEKMIQEEPLRRYASFAEVSHDISAGILNEMEFTSAEKAIYQNFADELNSHINYFSSYFEPVSNIETIIGSLTKLVRENALELFIQGNNKLISIFVDGGYNYKSVKNIEVETVKNFYKMLIAMSDTKKRVVIDNIYARLDTIMYKVDDEEIPF